MSTVLVVGGAGYIGAHMVLMLADRGHTPVVMDNLCTGHAASVEGHRLVEGDLGDEALLDQMFSAQRVDAVMHFGAVSQVAESMRDPALYYDNNTVKTAALLRAMRRHRIDTFIFSSTAAVYGMPDTALIGEDHPTRPINPYGRSKLAVEWMLSDFAAAYGLRAIVLRYFNAAGADPLGRTGECHEPESHLIPLVLRAASGRLPKIKVFGRDYDTPDGTCIRDYIHVTDLCEAHALALDRLQGGGSPGVFNLGNGEGFSVQAVIETARRVTGAPIPSEDAERRPGDPARLVADSRKALAELGWKPRYSDLATIVGHAWQWELRLAGRGA